MPIRVFLLFVLFATNAVASPDADQLIRESWVKTLKSFLKDLEKKEASKLNLTVEERRFLKNFSLIESAWADARFDCFYGGWPSSLVSSGGRRLCNSPKSRRDFSNSPCAQNQLLCQPLLFGPGVCAAFVTSDDRRSAFSNCEKNFTEKGGSYEFLKNLGPREHEDLRELSLLAGDICQTGNKGTQKNSPMCRELLRKLNDGLRSIDQGWKASFQPQSKTPQAPANVIPQPTLEIKPEDCVEPQPAATIAHQSLDQMYEVLKQKFEASAFCDPLKVVSNPAERPNPFLLRELSRDMTFLELLPFNNPVSEDPRLTQLLSKFRLNSDVSSKARVLLEKISRESLGSEARKRAISEMRLTLFQGLAQNSSAEASLSPMVRQALAENHIFRKEANGFISCPFVTKDAFLKAMNGRTAVLAEHGRSLPKKDLLTIVDYSRPSNERRLFVIDLDSLEVAHNTWVAHGGGDGNGPGVDGLGSSPQMSNVGGSKLSSNGFIIAANASSGARFGPNVLLRGIDQHNTSIAARSVILHGWTAPMDDFSNGVSPYDFETGTYAPKRDPVSTLLSVNPSSASSAEIEGAIKNIRSSTWVPDYLQPTEGCLGISTVKSGYLDRRGRDKTQLELLREDLPGSLIFNYSGPGMTSKYFRN